MPHEILSTVKAHSDGITALCLLPDGVLASASRDKAIQLWDPESREQIAAFEGHIDAVTSLCLLADGRICSGSHDDTIRIWEVRTAAQTACITIEGNALGVRSLCPLPDGLLAGGLGDHRILIWDISSFSQPRSLKAHWGPVRHLCLVTADLLASVAEWDGHSFPPEGQDVFAWHLPGGAEAHDFKVGAFIEAICAMAGDRLAVACSDKTIRIHDARSREQASCLLGHRDVVVALCTLPDGRLVSGSKDKTVKVWKASGLAQHSSIDLESTPRCLAPLPDGRLVAGDDQGLLHWLKLS